MTYTLHILAGDAAKTAYQLGERDLTQLKKLGFFRALQFEEEQSKDDFIRGFELGARLIDPLLVDLTESVLFGDTRSLL